MSKAEIFRYRLEVPKTDDFTNQWVAAQSNRSVSLRFLIAEARKKYGCVDVIDIMCAKVGMSDDEEVEKVIPKQDVSIKEQDIKEVVPNISKVSAPTTPEGVQEPVRVTEIVLEPATPQPPRAESAQANSILESLYS